MSICLTISASANALSNAAKPGDVGFSSERLQRLTNAMQTDVDKGLLPGAVTLIARHGKVAYYEAVGFQDRENQLPMKTDAIFRIASLSKPITSVAVMMLVEEGQVQLEDPVSAYLPELRNLQVGVEKVAASGSSELTYEPARRDPTLQDLLRHTSGFTYGHYGKSLVRKAYLNSRLQDENQPQTEFIAKLAKLPLAAHPGTTWDYVRFSQMLLNGGALGGERLLSTQAFAFMATDHLPADVKYDSYYATNADWNMVTPTPERGYGFGLGFIRHW
jgi:CubicO group peptidase (beta-lactamase class C family)